MFELFLALFLACVSPAHHHSCNTNGHPITITADDDTGGDNGHPPSPPPPPVGN